MKSLFTERKRKSRLLARDDGAPRDQQQQEAVINRDLKGQRREKCYWYSKKVVAREKEPPHRICNHRKRNTVTVKNMAQQGKVETEILVALPQLFLHFLTSAFHQQKPIRSREKWSPNYAILEVRFLGQSTGMRRAKKKNLEGKRRMISTETRLHDEERKHVILLLILRILVVIGQGLCNSVAFD